MTTTTTSPTAELLAATTVWDVMRRGVITCPASASIPVMARAMVANGIHNVVIANSTGHDPLAVSDLELLGGATHAASVPSYQPTAADLARELILTISTRASAAHAVDVMSTQSVSHLLAIDPDSGEAVGVVSTLDVAALAAGVKPRLARMLRPGPARPSVSTQDLNVACAADVMHARIATCDPDVPIATVARLMADQRTHCSAVSGIDTTPGREHRLTWGLIEALDLLGAVHRDQLDWPAATILDATPMAVRENDSLASAAELMVTHERRHLVVVGRSGRPSGIVSTLDVARVLANG